MKEVRVAGATTQEITAAIDAALCVTGSTRGIMEQVAYKALGLPKEDQPSCCAGPTDRMKELVSIAAAVAVNCPTNLRKHVEAGRSVGVRDEEIQLVAGLARMIRGKAIEKVDDAVKELSVPVSVQAEACGESTTTPKSTPQPQVASGCCGPAVTVQPHPQLTQAAKGSCC
jgi:AhpD family alkylhydroperoxidase